MLWEGPWVSDLPDQAGGPTFCPAGWCSPPSGSPPPAPLTHPHHPGRSCLQVLSSLEASSHRLVWSVLVQDLPFLCICLSFLCHFFTHHLHKIAGSCLLKILSRPVICLHLFRAALWPLKGALCHAVLTPTCCSGLLFSTGQAPSGHTRMCCTIGHMCVHVCTRPTHGCMHAQSCSCVCTNKHMCAHSCAHV